jgi:hypothetical protein
MVAGAAAMVLVSLSLVIYILVGKSEQPNSATTAAPKLAANTEVHLAFDASPATTTVNYNGSTTMASAGLTLPRGTSSVELTFAADGYQGKTVSVVPSGARTIAVTLTKVAAPAPSEDTKLAADDEDPEVDTKKHRKREHHRRHKSSDGDGKDGALPELMKIKK